MEFSVVQAADITSPKKGERFGDPDGGMKKSHAAKSVARGYEGSGREFQGLNFIQHL